MDAAFINLLILFDFAYVILFEFSSELIFYSLLVDFYMGVVYVVPRMMSELAFNALHLQLSILH